MHTRLIALLLATSLSSCTLPGTDGVPVSRKSSKAPDIRLNPNPTRAHRVTVTVKGAPGPFRWVEGVAHYSGHYEKHPNISCSYRLSLVGVNVKLSKSSEIALKQVSENVYEGIAYSDLVLDENYGKGLCRWRLAGIGALMLANDNMTDTRFSPYVHATPNSPESSQMHYFWNGRYPRTSIDGFVELGHLDKTQIKSELHDDLFTITISIKDVP